MNCPNCGGEIIGDGYTSNMKCENAEDVDFLEPDAEIVLCNFTEDVRCPDCKSPSRIGLRESIWVKCANCKCEYNPGG